MARKRVGRPPLRLLSPGNIGTTARSSDNTETNESVNSLTKQGAHKDESGRESDSSDQEHDVQTQRRIGQTDEPVESSNPVLRTKAKLGVRHSQGSAAGGMRYEGRSGVQTPPMVKQAMKDRASAHPKRSSEGHGVCNDLPFFVNGERDLPKTKQELIVDDETARVQEECGIFSWSDAQLAERYTFEKEIGFGNWGSCWLARARLDRAGIQSDKLYAIKVVHRQGTPPSNARVKALWNEFKVLRACGKPSHPNLVHFKQFAITPSYALVVMEYYRQAMNVALPETLYAGSNGYFHQLLSSIAWLHQRSVTHCDIKVANLLVDMSKDKERGNPILVDFGFATLHDAKSKFMSTQTWGTPEYLSPERNRGDLHDERLSDIWALGVTFFEIATGRTPFEHEEEQFLTKEQLDVYYKRTLEPEWVGTWSISVPLEKLCRSMLSPDPSRRTFAEEALGHPFFRVASARQSRPASDSAKGMQARYSSRMDSSKEGKGIQRASEKKGLTDIANGIVGGEIKVKKSVGKADTTNLTPQKSASLSNPVQNTPPIPPPKNSRREQIRIVVDETDTESSGLLSASSPRTSSVKKEDGSAYVTPNGKVARLLNSIRRASRKGSNATETSTLGEGRNLRKGAPYPPSSSRKLQSMRPATSSSELRHSPQVQEVLYPTRPATAQDRETRQFYDKNSNGHVSRFVGKLESDPEDSDDSLKGDDAKHVSGPVANLLAQSQSCVSEKVHKSAETPALHLLAANKSKPVTQSASRDATPQEVKGRKENVDGHLNEEQWFRPTNIVSQQSGRLTQDELEEKLEQMDQLAATLVRMVRETRTALLRRNTTQLQTSISTANANDLSQETGADPLVAQRVQREMVHGMKREDCVHEASVLNPVEGGKGGSGPRSMSICRNGNVQDGVSPKSSSCHTSEPLQLAQSNWQRSTISPRGSSCQRSDPRHVAQSNWQRSTMTAEWTRLTESKSPVSSTVIESIVPSLHHRSTSVSRTSMSESDQKRFRSASRLNDHRWPIVCGANSMLSDDSLAVPVSNTEESHAQRAEWQDFAMTRSPILMERHYTNSVMPFTSSPQMSPTLAHGVDETSRGRGEQQLQRRKYRNEESKQARKTSNPFVKNQFSSSLFRSNTELQQAVKAKALESPPQQLERSTSVHGAQSRRYSILDLPSNTLTDRRRTTITDFSNVGDIDTDFGEIDTSATCSPVTPPHGKGDLYRALALGETWTQPRAGQMGGVGGQFPLHAARMTFTQSPTQPQCLANEAKGARGLSNIGCDPPRAHIASKRIFTSAQSDRSSSSQKGSPTSNGGALWRLLTNRVTAGRQVRQNSERG